MSKTTYDVDLCVIGAGSGGLSVASGAAQLGRSVVLFEKAEMGGDCLNTGCVPSKAIISAGRAAQMFRDSEIFGLAPKEPKVNFERVKAHVKEVIAKIAPHDSQERFEGLGCTVIREGAAFKDARTVVSASTEVHAKRFVIATGSVASAPPIPGLDQVKYLTNENIFDVAERPEHLLIIGAGPIGLELGQTFRRLGAKVSIFDVAEPLANSEPDHAKGLIAALKDEGVDFHAPVNTKEIREGKAGIEIELESGDVITGSHILVAAGRRSVTQGLNLDAAGVEHDKRGIAVNDRLRTSNKRVYAIGDVAAGMGGLTHAAGWHGSLIIQNFYFPVWPKAITNAMPRAIYTSPELASVGLTESQAQAKYGEVKVVTADFSGNDRAVAERATHGGLKIVTDKKGKILGASLLGEGAGDIIQLVVQAMANGQKIRALTNAIAPYPTRGEIVKRAAGSYYTPLVFSDKAKWLAGLLTKFQ